MYLGTHYDICDVAYHSKQNFLIFEKCVSATAGKCHNLGYSKALTELANLESKGIFSSLFVVMLRGELQLLDDFIVHRLTIFPNVK